LAIDPSQQRVAYTGCCEKASIAADLVDYKARMQ